MTVENLVTPAVSGENGDDAAVTAEMVQISKEELDKYKLAKEKYHEYAWKYHKLRETANIQKPTEPNLDNIDEETQKLIDYTVDKKINHILEHKEAEATTMKEEQAFLKNYPDAYEKLEDIRSLKDKYPDLSHVAIYKFLYNEEPVAKQPSIKTTENPKVAKWDILDRDSVNASFNKFLGIK